MTCQKKLLRCTLLCFTLALGACSFFNDKKDPDKTSSSSSSLGTSSSSDPGDPDRAEIEYGDTIFVDDSLAYRVPDSVAESSPWNLYLGHYPRGTVLHLSLKSRGIEAGAKFRVKNESGLIQLPTNILPDSTYANYMVAADSLYLTNHFVLMDTGYYFLEITGERNSLGLADSIPDLFASLDVDTAFFKFTGSEDSLTLASNLDLQGCFRLDRQEDSTIFHFSSYAGNNLTLTSTGQNLDGVRLFDEAGSLLDSVKTEMRRQLLPQDSTSWTIKLRTIIPAWNSGNYAFFTFRLNSIKLGKGEYLAYPDTMPQAGDTLSIDRKGSDASGWDVRHDHYVWLGNLTVGDSLHIWYGMQGINKVQKLLRVLDSAGTPVDTLSQVLTNNWMKQDPNLFQVPKTGKYFLQYTGLGNSETYWIDPTFTIHLNSMVQKPGSLLSWTVTPGTLYASVGDTLFLADSLQSVTATPTSASAHYLFRVPREDRSVLKDSLDIALESIQPTGDQVMSAWMKAILPEGITRDTALLLIQSTADPRQVDTCRVIVE
jgi:hypothetical protein